ncbi:hypothetical protein CK203_043974 [Vitis vinifera]|uniref:Uncharacterized protein n=1 Tax=Vitis vinifera TaxID=29760 RepID=A0A438HTL7_VITVI|nr:hypothetical protein CK203_043974 [Vitis vinifera]
MPKRHFPPFSIWSPRLKALSFSRNPLIITVYPQLLSQPPITVNLARLSETSLAINQSPLIFLPWQWSFQLEQGRRPPCCQIYRQEGHYADKCNQWYAQGGEPVGTIANLAEAFKASYSLNGPEPSDWYLDTGASAHMTLDLSHLDQASNYMESSNGKGGWQLVKEMVAYMCWSAEIMLFIYVLKNKALHASYDLWHARLGHHCSLHHQPFAHTASQSIPYIFLGIAIPTKVFVVLIPPPLSFISPAMLNLMNTTFSSRDGSQVQPSSSLHFLNFLEPSMPHIDPHPMSPLHYSPPITPSKSNPCVICPDLVDKSLQVTDSFAGPSSPSLEPRPPLVASDVAPTPVPPLGSHPMLTRAKVGIFKTRHAANLRCLKLLWASLCSSCLHLA